MSWTDRTHVYSFGPPLEGSYQGAGPDGVYRREIFADGVPIGRMSYVEEGLDRIVVQWIETSQVNAQGGRTQALGTGAMRQLGAQLRAEGINTVAGERVSGARSGMAQQDAYIEVSLSGGKNLIGTNAVGRERGDKGDQPRVPAGSPEGGQFAPKDG